jgi:hypothetical protein
MKRSPTALSMDYMNKQGWVCHVVEKRLPIPGKHITQDCYGIADILAYNPAYGRFGIVLIQTTSWGNFLARKAKVKASPHLDGWNRAGGLFLLHGWGPKGLREETL